MVPPIDTQEIPEFVNPESKHSIPPPIESQGENVGGKTDKLELDSIEQTGGKKPRETNEGFRSPTIASLYDLVNEGVIRLGLLENGEKCVRVDVERAISFLENQPFLEEYEISSEEEKGELTNRARLLLKEVEKAFITNGVMTEALARQVRRLLQMEDIEITDGDYHRFLFPGFTFPSEGDEERSELQLSARRIHFLEGRLEKITKEAGINISHEKLRTIVLRWGLSHEYGHAIDRVIRLMQTERKAKEKPQLPLWRVTDEVETEINNFLIEKMVDEEINGVLEGEPVDGKYTRKSLFLSEQIATGFEIIGLTQALIDEGIPPAEVEKIMKSFALYRRERLNQFSELVCLARNKGLRIEDLGEAVGFLLSRFKEEKRERLLRKLPLEFNLGLLGYYKPLSKDELYNYLKEYGEV